MEADQFDLDYVYQLVEWLNTTESQLKSLTHLKTILDYVFENITLVKLHPEIMITIRKHCREATTIIVELMEKGGSSSVGERLLHRIESFTSLTDHLAEFDVVEEVKTEDKPEQSPDREPVAKEIPEKESSDDEDSWWNKS